MSNESVTVTYSLEEVLARLEQKIDSRLEQMDRRFEQLENKIDRIGQDTSDIKVELATLNEKVEGMDNRLRVVEGTQKNQVWTLIILLAGAIVTASVKLFGIMGNP
ncbi:MAG: hypothetical protein AB4058_12565 [Microcystaceae cyanobacterium]